MDAAGAALESGDATSFVIGPIVELFGPWAGVTAGVLLVTSLLAGIIAFHNGINRYLHSLALRGSMPAVVARTNRHRAPPSRPGSRRRPPSLLVVPFAATGAGPRADPVLLVQRAGRCGTAGAVHAVLRRRRRLLPPRTAVTAGLWQTLIAPALAPVLLAWVLYLVVSNFTALIGGSAGDGRGPAGGRPRGLRGGSAGGEPGCSASLAGAGRGRQTGPAAQTAAWPGRPRTRRQRIGPVRGTRGRRASSCAAQNSPATAAAAAHAASGPAGQRAGQPQESRDRGRDLARSAPGTSR